MTSRSPSLGFVVLGDATGVSEPARWIERFSRTEITPCAATS